MTFHLLFLIYSLCFLSFLLNVGRHFSVLLNFSKNQIWLSYFSLLFVSSFTNFHSLLYLSFALFGFNFVTFTLGRLSIDFKPVILSIKTIESYTFPSMHCFHYILQILVSGIFIFISFKIFFKISGTSPLTCNLFPRVLFNFQVFGGFSSCLLLTDFHLIPLWSENIFCMMAFVLNLGRCVLWPR